MSPAARNTVALCVLLAAAGLAWWVLGRADEHRPPEPTDPVHRTDATGEAAPRREGAPAPSDGPLAGPIPGDSPESGERAALVVRLLDAATGEPVRDASVHAYASAAALDAGVLLAADVVASGHPGPDGRVRLEPPASGALRLVAKGPWHASADARLSPPWPPETVLRLPPGLSIEGVVVDRSGAPLEGIEVRGRHADDPRMDDPSREVAPGRDVARTTTDADGAFRLEGLRSGLHHVEPTTAGWVLEQSSLLFRPRVELETAVSAQAGAQDVRIVLVPMRVVALALTSASGPVDATAAFVDVAPDGQGVRTSSSTWDPSAAALQPGGRILTHVLPEPGSPVPERARVTVVVDGYAPGVASVALQAPGDVLWLFEPVRLEPLDPTDDGVLVVEAEGTRPEGSNWKIAACRLEDGRMVHRRGEALATGARFRGLPTGPLEVHVHDGASTSLPERVEVRRDREARVRVRFPPPTGAAFAMRSRAGRRLFDADTLLVLEPGRERGAPNLSHLTRLRLTEQGRVEEPSHPLLPGSYRWVAAKTGWENASGTFEVTAGEVTRVECVLDEAKPRRR